ncbi:putative lipid-transfer protein DIR1 [Lathyrus oleraceus]|uniref:Bifunctional inhibitor/plant lipid transfer protein/seed storage helical domain-containing protein n=1 Tax=Pisum sativum TaxID=3888 RepID=A0A9D4VSH3_PEA|nr:putative lipid-transfer protein DIR1 [Pisum sativum]KAI5388622.1 hypothetical protein KIW84_074338 [Pisum sativum]
MEAYKKVLIVGMLLVIANTMFANGVTICNMTRDERKACEPYVSNEKNYTHVSYKVPSHACCSATANADLQCFCGYKDSGLLSLYGINPKQALELPVKCKIVDAFHCK